MKRISLILTIMFAAVWSVSAQNREELGQWMDQMRQYKRTYFTKELDLSKEQQQKFFPLYEEMEDETTRMEDETRAMERRVAEAPDATDLEYEKATEALFDMTVKQAALEKGYMEKFRDILSPRQLFELKGVERKFARDMMRQHHRLRNNRRVDAGK